MLSTSYVRSKVNKLKQILFILLLSSNLLAVYAVVSLGTDVEYIPTIKSLGIGFQSPSEKLAVNGNILASATVQGETLIVNGATLGGFFTDGGDSAGAARTIGNLDDYSLSLLTNGVTALTVNSSQSVGIGDTTPDYLLDVAGTLGVDGVATLSSASIGGGYGDSGVTISAAGAVQADGAITAASTLDVSGATTMSANLNLSGTAANIALGSNYLSGDAGDEGVYIDSTGNAGIGMASPNEKLTVYGRLALLEGSAPSNTASYGKFYVNSSDSQLYFVDDSNNASKLTFADNGALEIDNLVDGIYNSTATSLYLGTSSGASADSTALYNAGLGIETLAALTTGDYHSVFGYRAGYAMTTHAAGNTAFGYGALDTATASSYTATAIGYNALTALTTGYATAIGHSAGAAVTSGGWNGTYVGYQAGMSVTNPQGNEVAGYRALITNSTGGVNLAFGAEAGLLATTSYNTFIGYHAAYSATTGARNTYIGYQAGNGTTTGSDNIGLGYQAGDAITTGSYNIAIGAGVDVPSATTSSQLNIGDSIYANLATDSVGINDTSPDYLLDVNGTLGATGAVTLSSTMAVTGATSMAANLSLSGTSANIVLGSNYLAGDTDDEGIYADSSGNIGMGSSTTNSRLHITGSDNDVLLLSDGADCEAQPDTGGLTWSCSSDQRLKKDIVPARSVKDHIKSFAIKKFKFLPTGKENIGVIAQELQTNHPEMVETAENGYLRVSELNQWELIRLIQELKLELDDLNQILEEEQIQ